MTISLHASDETLMRHAFGTLGAGPMVVVAAHLAVCPRCRARAAAFECVGGNLLDGGAPEMMEAQALAQTLGRIDAPATVVPPAAPRRSALAMPDGLELPASLADCIVGAWRWVAPGIRLSRVRIPGAPKANVILFRVAPGKALPVHSHTGGEYIQVLMGAFDDGRHIYAPGDLSEADPDVSHQPVIESGGECISLAAVEGPARMQSLLGRLVQPFVGL